MQGRRTRQGAARDGPRGMLRASIRGLPPHRRSCSLKAPVLPTRGPPSGRRRRANVLRAQAAVPMLPVEKFGKEPC